MKLSTEQIVQGNKIIMLFDGWVEETHQTFDPDHNGGKNDYKVFIKRLEGQEIGRCRENDIEFDIVYHLSWDALMAVVLKLMQCKFEDGQYYYLRTFGLKSAVTGKPMVRFDRHKLFCEQDSFIESLWIAVVDCIMIKRRKDFMEKHNLGNEDMINDIKLPTEI